MVHNVGIIGMGGMGCAHLEVYRGMADVRVVAIADVDPDRLGLALQRGAAAGAGDAVSAWCKPTCFGDGKELIHDDSVDLVDICLQTPLHPAFVEAALNAGKHVLVEKPLARTHAQALAMAAWAEASPVVALPAMCMRFWPGWTWLKKVISEQVYGRTLSTSFRRLASPPGAAFYCDGSACGGVVLDLHIHDTDFVRYCFGTPEAVSSVGYTGPSNAIDHVMTQYHYPDVPMVCAEGGWAMKPGYGFAMQFLVNFEKATAKFDLNRKPQLRVWEEGQPLREIDLGTLLGYHGEIGHWLDCISHGRASDIVSLRDAAESIRVVEAEVESIHTRNRVDLT